MKYLQLIRGSLMAVAMALVTMPLLASADTLERIKTSGTFTIGFVSDQAPFSSAAPGGAKGYSIELCQQVADATKARLGLTDLAVKYTATSVAAGLEKVASGEVDLLCGSVTDTLKRRETVAFSIPIFNSGIGALIRTDAPPALVRVLNGEEAHTGPIWRSTIRGGLADHTYAVHAGTTTEAWVRKEIAGLRVTATVVTVDDHAKGVAMVLDRDADAYFADRTILQTYAARSIGADDLTIADRYFDYEPLALALARNDDDFRLLVDTTLSKLYRSDAFVDLYTRYFGKPSAITQTLFKAYARQ
jgi:polar amino acid transport system substrate-binding protein